MPKSGDRTKFVPRRSAEKLINAANTELDFPDTGAMFFSGPWAGIAAMSIAKILYGELFSLNDIIGVTPRRMVCAPTIDC